MGRGDMQQADGAGWIKGGKEELRCTHDGVGARWHMCVQHCSPRATRTQPFLCFVLMIT